jgi:hypothetical protein
MLNSGSVLRVICHLIASYNISNSESISLREFLLSRWTLNCVATGLLNNVLPESPKFPVPMKQKGKNSTDGLPKARIQQNQRWYSTRIVNEPLSLSIARIPQNQRWYSRSQ